MQCFLVSAVLRGSVETLDKPSLFKCFFCLAEYCLSRFASLSFFWVYKYF